MAPEQPEDVTEENRKWLTSAAIQQGGHREHFLVELGDHLDGPDLNNGAELLPYRLIFAVYDADAAGCEGAAYLANQIERVQEITAPHKENLVGFHVSEGNLRNWCQCHLKQLTASATEAF